MLEIIVLAVPRALQQLQLVRLGERLGWRHSEVRRADGDGLGGAVEEDAVAVALGVEVGGAAALTVQLLATQTQQLDAPAHELWAWLQATGPK